MATRVRPLRMEDLDALPDPCRGCMFWQSARARRGVLDSDPAAQDAWWRAVQLEWGVPGQGLWRGDRLIGFALFAPAGHVGRRRVLSPPASPDALILMTMWVDPAFRGGGLARHLLQVVVREAVLRDHQAIEAYGAVMVSEPDDTGACIVGGRFLEHLGFRAKATAAGTVLYRLETARTVRWTESVGQALGDVVAALSGRQRAPSRPALESRPQTPAP